jgi:catechol 2,3-dioxygenase-like lactoylglutathione lyase family enzyme
MAAWNHLGQCVSDLDRSRQFYESVFGFIVEREIYPPDVPSDRLLGLKAPLGMTACYLRLDSLVLELLHFSEVDLSKSKTRVMNETGLTHLSLSVEDLSATCVRVEEFGGQVIKETDISVGIFVRDPDGQLIELLSTSNTNR